MNTAHCLTTFNIRAIPFIDIQCDVTDEKEVHRNELIITWNEHKSQQI